LEEELRGQEGGDRFYFFNSFFYKKLSEKNPGARANSPEHYAMAYERVKKWTKVGRGWGLDRAARRDCGWHMAALQHPRGSSRKGEMAMCFLQGASTGCPTWCIAFGPLP
jgi:hypothetical protein